MSHIYGKLPVEFWSRRPLIGMAHLAALPGSARSERSIDEITQLALADARALEAGGADALIVENFFDAPFAKVDVLPHTIAALACIVRAIRETVSMPIGVNVLRNDARAALAIAHVCDANFIRINVYVGAAVTDQGIIEGAARAAVLYRKELNANVAIWADIFVKHAVQIGGGAIEDAARDAVHRGLADALIVSGSGTGSATNPADLEAVRSAVPGARILVGSGADETSAPALLRYADGVIAGTSIKQGGRVEAPVDPHRVHSLRTVMDSVRHSR